MLNRKLFQKAARALYGTVYQSYLARDLGIHVRTCVRYDQGDRPVPGYILDRMVVLLALRYDEINNTMKALVEHRAATGG